MPTFHLVYPCGRWYNTHPARRITIVDAKRWFRWRPGNNVRLPYNRPYLLLRHPVAATHSPSPMCLVRVSAKRALRQHSRYSILPRSPVCRTPPAQRPRRSAPNGNFCNRACLRSFASPLTVPYYTVVMRATIPTLVLLAKNPSKASHVSQSTNTSFITTLSSHNVTYDMKTTIQRLMKPCWRQATRRTPPVRLSAGG